MEIRLIELLNEIKTLILGKVNGRWLTIKEVSDYNHNLKDFITLICSSVKHSSLNRQTPLAPFFKHDLIASFNFDGDNAPKNNPDKYIPPGFLYLTPFETLSDIQSILPS